MHEILRDTFLFSQLNEQQLEHVISFCKTVSLQDSDPLFEAGTPAGHFYLVKHGKIKLYLLAPNGNEKVIEVVSLGELFAEALMFASEPVYPVSAMAIDSTELLVFDSKAFLSLLRESVDTCFRMMNEMSLRLHRMIKEIDDLALQSATARVGSFLCSKHVIDGEGRSEFDLEMPKAVLASRLSVTPETFSRILNNFSTQGLLKVKGRHIVILDPSGLRELVHASGLCSHNPESGKKVHCI